MILIGWSIISIVLAAFFGLDLTQTSYFGWVVYIIAYGYLGHLIAKNKLKTDFGAKAGAITGAITGLVGGVLAIISWNFLRYIYYSVIQQATSQGAPQAAIESIMNISIYAGIIIGPLFGALIGAGITLLATVICRKL